MDEKKPRRPGRPSKLTSTTAAELVARLTRGDTISRAAADVGVTRRSVAAWRARAYSSRPEDRPYVEFEQSLTRGLIAAAEHERRERPVALQPLDDLFADLERGFARSERELLTEPFE